MKTLTTYILNVTVVLIFILGSTQTKASDFYWVGGSGNWSDYGNHWATTSGGVIFHTTIPSPLDDVYFDGNSFLTVGDTVFTDGTIVNCANIDWSGVSNNPSLNSSSGGTISIYGSLTLAPSMTWGNNITINFVSGNGGNTITTVGNYLGLINFNNLSGSWMLTDSLNAGVVWVSNGTFSSNNQNITCLRFNAGDVSPATNKATVLLGASHINCDYQWLATDTNNLTLDAANATFVIMGDTTDLLPGTVYFNGGSHHEYGDITSYSGMWTGSYNIYHDINIPLPLIHGGIVGENNTYHDIYFSDLGVLTLWICNAHNVYFNGDGRITMGNHNTFNKVVFNSNANAGSYNTYDTLIFNNPGKTITFSDTTFINNKLVMASGLGGFPTSVHSNTSGTKAIVSIPTGDTLCTDYLYLKDIEAINGIFYAGDNSIDLGNNTGWLWSSCIPDTTNVWPGDANYDLSADNLDVLYIGLAYGYTGPVRPGASTNWVGQPEVDWLQQFVNGTNIKHADCDGNGTVNASDTLAVSQNYGLVHPFKNSTPPQFNNSGIDLYFDLPGGALIPGSVVNIPIQFGTTSFPANNIYGIGFTVNYDPSLIQSGSMQIDFSNTWLGTSANTIHLTKDLPLNGTIDMGFVKTDHLNSNGNGTIATLTFIVANNASGFLNLTLSRILVLDRNEFPVAVNTIPAWVYTGINENPELENMVNIYPNPASSSISINDLNHIIQQVKLTDMTGREIKVKQNFDAIVNLDISSVSNGIYLLAIKTQKGILNKRIQICH